MHEGLRYRAQVTHAVIHYYDFIHEKNQACPYTP